MTKETMNTEELLELSFDDSIEDLPEFVNPPNGFYKATIKSAEIKEFNEKPCLAIYYIINETLELNDPESETPAPGSLVSEVYQMSSPENLPYLKRYLKPFIEKVGSTKLNELLDAMVGMEIGVVFKTTHDTKKDKYYTKSITIHFV